MRTVLFGLALCTTCLAEPKPGIEVVVPPTAAHPQDWLHPQIHDNPKPDYRGKPPGSLAELVAPEVISKIVVDQHAGPHDDVRHYLTAMPTAAAEYFGPSLELCQAGTNANGLPASGAGLIWTSMSTVTFKSGRSGRLAVATVIVTKHAGPNFAPSKCVGFDKVPLDSLYVSYIDPDGYSWYFAIPLQRKK